MSARTPGRPGSPGPVERSGEPDARPVGRRAALARTGAALLGAALIRLEAARAEVASLPPLADHARPTLAEFEALSRLLTGRTVLDAALSGAIYRAVLDEPWGPANLARTYERVRALLGPGDRARVLDPARFTEAERWFVEHLLVTWYTGIYYHVSGNRTLGFAHALVHEVLIDLRPVPTLSDRPPGFWAKAPVPRRPIG